MTCAVIDEVGTSGLKVSFQVTRKSFHLSSAKVGMTSRMENMKKDPLNIWGSIAVLTRTVIIFYRQTVKRHFQEDYLELPTNQGKPKYKKLDKDRCLAKCDFLLI